MEIIQFGGTKEEQTELAELVLNGVKTASSSLKILQDLGIAKESRVGDMWSICDGEGIELCRTVIEKVETRLFGEVDEAFAILEGDGSFSNWYKIHFNYYKMLLSKHSLELTDETDLECVYFRRINPKKWEC